MTDYPALRLIVVDNDSREAATAALLDDLQTDPRVQVLPSPGAFNFSALNNHAVATDNSEMVCFLNNDCEPLHPEWLAEMVALAAHQEVGLVGAKLLYPDETIQHAGLHLVGDNVAHHSFVGMAERDGGYMDRNNHLRNVAAVTGACMVMRRTVFDAVGGFDAVHFPIDFSDVDLCLRTRESGLQVVWTPHAVLTHHESASRGQFMSVAKETAHRAACQAMHERFGAALHDDPFYNPNLSFERADHQLAFPPRRR
jgi:GT2 family glycosyltransferase